MGSLRAERDLWRRSVQGIQAQPQRVFPDYIYVNLEGFKRASDPFWEPDRPTTSSLYKARVSAQGRIFCTRRMQRWLHGLPDRPEAHSEPISTGPSSVLGRPENIRPRAQSAPASGPHGPAAAGLDTDLSVPQFRFGHPNPLSQHPVQLERRHSHFQRAPSRLDTPPPQLERVDSQPKDHPQLEVVHSQLEFQQQLEEVTQLEEVPPRLVQGQYKPQEVPLHFEDFYFQPKIPQRRSSLYFTSQPASQVPQLDRPPSQFEDLFQGFAQNQFYYEKATESEQSQESGEFSENGSVVCQPEYENNMGVLTRPATKRHTIHFGSNLVEEKQHAPTESQEKYGRAQSVALAVHAEPEKPPRSLFGSIRNRRSALGTPTGDVNNGRKSSASVMLRDMRRSSKGFFSKLTVRKKEEYNLRVAFIGNQQSGKDVLLSRYTVTASTGNIIYRPDLDSFRIKQTGVLAVDNYKARTEVWDIAHRNVGKGQVHPLEMTTFDVVVICVDIGNERNLKSVAKWQRVVQRYCPDTPTILLGLKSDLRPDFPTLRLGFLKESTAFTVGQGEEAARKNKASAYYECSAKTGEGVTEFFESLVRFSVQASRPRTKLGRKASRRLSNLFRKK